MTTSNVERMKLLEARAKPGPWNWDKRRVDEDGYVFIPQCAYLGGTLISLADTYENSGIDCDLLAAARNCLPALLEIAEAVEYINDPSPTLDDDTYMMVRNGDLKRLKAALSKFSSLKIEGM